LSDITAKEKILQAAIEEFSKEGYKAASTNSIAKNSGVSKGLIFHYFGSKEKLYNECFEGEYINYIKYLLLYTDTPAEDYLSRIMRIIAVQVEYILKTGKNASLLMDWYQSNYSIKWNKAEQEVFLKKYKKLKGYTDKVQELIMNNVDMSMLRQDIEKEKLLDYALMVIEMCWLRFSSRYQNDLHEAMENIEVFYEEMKLISKLLEFGITRS